MNKEIKIFYNSTNQKGPWWNELCARIIELFGLPGNKYTTEVCSDFMSFKFKNEKDAFLCKIMLSEHLGC